jgi:chemotaxis protein MotB
MAAGDKKSQIIIVKRIKKGSHGHHGGAWKIAYADFVTAMMAFFLLMWLLGSTTKGDLQGIADHFSTPLKIALQGGIGSGDSSSIVQGGGQDLTRSVGQVKRGEVDSGMRKAISLQAARGEILRQERALLEELKARVEAAIAANPRTSAMRSQMRLDLTPEGLRIQIVDDQSRAMFDSGSAVVREHMRDLLRQIGRVLNEVPNRVSLSGHTDSAPFGAGERGYSNWELSADRANASRRELVAGGMDDSKIVRVVGVASAVPLDAQDPRHPVNRRISIVVMNRVAESRLLKGAELVDESAESSGQ